MNESIFGLVIKEALVEIIEDLRFFPPKEIIFQGSMYAYQRSKSKLAQRRHIILTKNGFFIINRRKSDPESGQQFVTVRINTNWAMVYCMTVDQEKNPDLGSLPYQISFVLNGHVANFYLNNPILFNEWNRVLGSVGIQTNFESKYIIGESIGRGSSASVNKVTCKTTRQVFACKIFKKEKLKHNIINLKGLINEINILRDIKGHPNLIQIVEIQETEKNTFIITELIEGSKIFHKKIQYEAHEICNVVESLLSALVFLKDKGIVHRDIKPDNLLLKYKDKPLHLNEIKIIDFGLATYFNASSHIFNNCGTLGYVAPEILNSALNEINFTPAVDIYSFGIVIFNFITGVKVFREESTRDIYKLNKIGKIPFYHSNFRTASLPRQLISTRSCPENAHK
jgi:serine/threonine protein kinase